MRRPPVSVRSAARFAVSAQSHAEYSPQRDRARRRGPLAPVFLLALAMTDPSFLQLLSPAFALTLKTVPELFTARVKVVEQQLHLRISLGPCRVREDCAVIS